MATPEEAAAAIEMFNGQDLGGRNITVNEAKPKRRAGGVAVVVPMVEDAVAAVAVVIVPK